MLAKTLVQVIGNSCRLGFSHQIIPFRFKAILFTDKSQPGFSSVLGAIIVVLSSSSHSALNVLPHLIRRTKPRCTGSI